MTVRLRMIECAVKGIIAVSLPLVATRAFAFDPAGLIHRWSFNGTFDDTVGGRTAKNLGQYSWTDGGRSIRLPGGNYGTSGLDLGANLLPQDGSPVTIEIWARNRTIQHWARIFDVGCAGDDSTYAWIYDSLFASWSRERLSGTDGVEIIDNGVQKQWDHDKLSPYSLGQEYHLSFVVEPNRDGDGKTVLSCAKRDVATGKVLKSFQNKTAFKWSLADIDQKVFYLGRSICSKLDSDSSADYNEVRIWNRALSEAELTENALEGVDVGLLRQEVVDGVEWTYHVKFGKAAIRGVETSETRLTVPQALGGYALGAIETNAFHNASNVVELTIPGGVTIEDKALASCVNLKAVNFKGLPVTTVVPGFRHSKFENVTNRIDEEASVLSNANTFVLAADMMTATNVEERSMHAYAGYMRFDGISEYEFLIDYDNWAVIKIDGVEVLRGSCGDGGATTRLPPLAGWHGIDLRGGKRVGAGVTCGGGNQGVKWRKVGESEWRPFADSGDGSLFRAKMGNLADTLVGTAVESVSFGEGVVTIPEGYFVGATGLKAITLPDSLVDLGDNDLRFIGRNGGKTGLWIQKDWLLGSVGTVVGAVVVSNEVARIAPYAFEGQTGLTRIILPDTLVDIGTNAFRGCAGLASVYVARGKMSNVVAMLTASGLTNAEEIVRAKEVSAPVITPGDGTVIGGSQTISMSCATDGAKIHYTTDGTPPTGESTAYRRFRISSKTTIQAIAILDGVITSGVSRAEYAFGACESPVISLADGTVFLHANQEVSITCHSDGTIRYTLDGTDPTSESPAYAAPFTISESTVVKAKVFSERLFDSRVVTVNLTREWERVATPVVGATASDTGAKTVFTLTCATEGATIRYTTTGLDPNPQSTAYTGPFEVAASCTVKAYAVRADYEDSETATWVIGKVSGAGDTLGAPDREFTAFGAKGWVRDAVVSFDGSESMRSGGVAHEQTSALTTVVSGKGCVSFWWKTSCECDEELHDWDHVEFSVDGVEIARMDGLTNWRQVTHELTADGDHTLTWTYKKDDVEVGGQDCAWIDAFRWVSDLTDPIPPLGDTPTAAEIAAALSGSSDARLAAHLTTGAKYNAYRAWVGRVAGASVADRQAVKDSPFAWLSYALDSSVLLTKAPEQGEMRVAAFERNLMTGQFDFAVAIEGVTVGENATAGNLATIFSVEGCTTVDGAYGADDVVYAFGTPTDGQVTISAEPKDAAATRFFLKVKMTP